MAALAMAPASPSASPVPSAGRSSASPSAHTAESTYDTIPYQEDFTDTLMDHVLSESLDIVDPGIVPVSYFTPSSTAETPKVHVSVLSSVGAPPSPALDADEHARPVQFHSVERRYQSSIPGLLVTHPGGWIEGGVGPAALEISPSGKGIVLDSETSAYASSFLPKKGRGRVSVPSQLRHIEAERSRQMEILKMRMEERAAAKRSNDEIERQIKMLEAQREVERKVAKTMGKDNKRVRR